MVVGAADRLVTFGDVEYEQPRPKILRLTSHISVLLSGYPEIHTEIIGRAYRRVSAIPNVTVEAAATIYADEYAAVRRERAVKKHLVPLGLTLWSFTNNQTNVSAGLLGDLTEALRRENLHSRAIIVGVDQSGAHLYIVQDPGELVHCDMVGWAAIGTGSRHADSQFIAEKYSLEWEFDEAILLTYLAKKKADLSPGVGLYTDLFWIGQQEGYVLMSDDLPLVQQMKKLHIDIEKAERRLRSVARKRIKQFVRKDIAEQPAPAEPVLATGSGGNELSNPPSTLQKDDNATLEKEDGATSSNNDAAAGG